jgi:sugar phosphate isomerase/epimerase
MMTGNRATMQVPPPLSRLCVHTITTKPLGLAEAVAAYRRAEVSGITVWRDAAKAAGFKESAKILAESGLAVVSYCRGGFFPAASGEARRAAIDDNRRVIDEAAVIGAPLIVLVCGAVPGMSLEGARGQITDAIADLAPYAEQAGIRLGIEPLHPMYADSRSAINTLGQANDVVEKLDTKQVGVTIDVYHLWWDDRLEHEIARAGRAKSIFSFHVCDWLSPTKDMLNDRGLMGEGCIDIRRIRSWVEAAGFEGAIEVEIFSDRLWAGDQREFLDRIRGAYLKHV